MADDTQDPKGHRPTLSEAALTQRALRRPREGDRTTLSMGQPEGEDGTMPAPDELGEVLVERNLISRHDLFNALNESYRRDVPLRDALLAMELIDEAALEREGL